MNSKPSKVKTPKTNTRSKKILKGRGKKSISTCLSCPSQPKKQHRSCLPFYLSEQCEQVLTPFCDKDLYPKALQTATKENNQLFLAFNSFKAQDIKESFEDSICSMRFLTNSQEGLIEKFLQEKYSCSKNNANLQEIYCYNTAKNLLQSQFNEFFTKRNEFVRQKLQQQEKYENSIETNENRLEVKDGYNYSENSFSATNVSSPSICASSALAFGHYNYQESYYNPQKKFKTVPEMMLSLLNEQEEGNQIYCAPGYEKIHPGHYNDFNIYSTDNNKYEGSEENFGFQEKKRIEKVRVEDLFLDI